VTKSQRRDGRRGEMGRGQGLSEGGWALFGYECRSPEFVVTPLLMGPVCLLTLYQGRFEESVHP